MSSTPRFRVLDGDLPESLDAAGVVETLPFGDWAPADRPYVAVNMVATLDGRAAIDGRAGPLGNEADRQLFQHLRQRGDAVMVGAGTVRAEGYRRVMRPEHVPLRERFGVRPNALVVVVSRSLDLPPETPLLAEPGNEVAIVTDSAQELPPTAARVTYLRMPLAEAPHAPAPRARHPRDRLRGRADAQRVALPACPGRRALPHAGADAGGRGGPAHDPDGPALDPPLRLERAWLLDSGGYLFARYVAPAVGASVRSAG